jgi:hypothetical protein
LHTTHQIHPCLSKVEKRLKVLPKIIMSGGSSTATVELHEAPIHKLDGPTPLAEHPSLDIGTSPARPGRTLGKDSPRGSSDRPRSNGDSNRDSISSLPPPSTVSHTVERWNQSRVNVCRVFAAFWSLLVMGMNDSAYGAIIPYLGTYYRLEYTLVSLIFLSPFVGYTLSALLNNLIHEKFGQRGVAIICSSCHLIAYVIACVHPPYPVLVVVYMLAGFGNGLGDAAWNACKQSAHKYT